MSSGDRIPARGGDAFAADRSLKLWMAASLALGALSTLVLVALVAYLAVGIGVALSVIFVAFLAAGVVAGVTAPEGDAEVPGRAATDADRDRVTAVLARLAVIADVPPPACVVTDDAAARSRTSADPLRSPRISVSTGLLDALDDRGVSVVLAHELSHVMHRDARVMSLLGMPGVVLLRGFSRLDGVPGFTKLKILLSPALYASLLSARLLSRHREVAADRGAALLLGSPSAVAVTLRELSSPAHAPGADLRGSAASDLFSIVPARPQGGIRRLWATHPTLERRVACLTRLEGRLQR